MTMSKDKVELVLRNQAAIHRRANLLGESPSDDAVERVSKALDLLSAFDPRIGQLDKLIAQQRQWLER